MPRAAFLSVPAVTTRAAPFDPGGWPSSSAARSDFRVSASSVAGLVGISFELTSAVVAANRKVFEILAACPKRPNQTSLVLRAFPIFATHPARAERPLAAKARMFKDPIKSRSSAGESLDPYGRAGKQR